MGCYIYFRYFLGELWFIIHLRIILYIEYHEEYLIYGK